MNKAAKQLYSDLRNSKLGAFDMNNWCGTSHCIGGEAEKRMIAENPENYDRLGRNAEEVVAEYLGLTPDIAATLFYPDCRNGVWKHPNPYNSTQPEAAAALKRACELSAQARQLNRKRSIRSPSRLS